MPRLITWSRVLWATVGAILLAGGGLFAIVLPVVRPSADAVKRADAVIMLSGDQGNRLAVALRLIHDGLAPTLVIDGLPDFPQAKELCQTKPSFEVVCLDPQPDKTQTEAQVAGRLARSRGWNHVLVVTDPVHFARARLLFRRCLPGTVSVVGEPPPTENHHRALVHEVNGLAYSMVAGLASSMVAARGC